MKKIFLLFALFLMTYNLTAKTMQYWCNNHCSWSWNYVECPENPGGDYCYWTNERDTVMKPPPPSK